MSITSLHQQHEAHQLFNILDKRKCNLVEASEIKRTFSSSGFSLRSPMLQDMRERLSQASPEINYDQFLVVVGDSLHLLKRIVWNNCAVKNWSGLTQGIVSCRAEALEADATCGSLPTYIPILTSASQPESLGVAFCSVSGQEFSQGVKQTPITLQSCVLPILYAVALEESGETAVHTKLGREPSGMKFNDLHLNPDGLPFNPYTNAGGIQLASMIYQSAEPYKRFMYCISFLRSACGNGNVGFSNASYLSEKENCWRNLSICYHMKESGCFASSVSADRAIEFYLQANSIEMSVQSLAVVAATLANAGICPLTNERVMASSTVRSVLSLMASCGMGSYSGEWAFEVGLPAKSGISGLTMVVVPGMGGWCAFGPLVDKHGNSIRCLHFYKSLGKFLQSISITPHYDWDLYDGEDPSLDTASLITPQALEVRRRTLGAAWLYAACTCDLVTMQQCVADGVDVDFVDYDMRSAMHLAVRFQHIAVVRYLLALLAQDDIPDRWGRTPVDYALTLSDVVLKQSILAMLPSAANGELYTPPPLTS
jgi:glutaminase